jgi:hypothetical protein
MVLLIACEHEHRSQANMIEFLIIDYFRRNGMAYPPEGAGQQTSSAD